MKKLIASTPIQYMGSIYEIGETLPANDQKMVDAWLAAGTAKWQSGSANAPHDEKTTDPAERVNAAAGAALRDLGFKIDDGAGNFVGTDAVMEQITEYAHALISAGMTGNDGKTPEETANAGQNANGDATTAGAGAEVKMVPGHLDEAQLARMTKAKLQELADEMGVDISNAKNNAERAKILADVEVLVPADETTGTQ